MKPIDTKTWKEFKVGDLFELTGVKQAKSQKLIPTIENGIPYVVQSQSNNMVSRRVDKQYLIDNDEPICEGNVIVLGVTLPAVSYQPTEFGASQVITAYNKHLNEGVGLFLAAILRQQMSRFSYINKPGISKYKELMLKLPIQQTLDPDKTYHPEGYIPDWDYMEAFMEQINQQAQARLDEYKEGKLEYTTSDKIGYTPVDTKSWAEFKVGDLFEKISRGTRLKKANRITGDKPLLTAGGYNNGVSEYIEKHDVLYTGTNLTIDMFGNSFVHTYPFYADDNILIFNNKKYNENHLLFIKTALTYLKTQYGFQKQYRLNSVEKTVVKLPVDTNGQPDWDYMEAFMKQINQQAQAKLSILEKGNI